MKKNIALLSLLFLSGTAFAQSFTSVNADLFPNKNKKISKRFMPRISFETLNLDQVDDKSGRNSKELGRVNMGGVNIGFSFETSLTERLTTYTIPSFSYVLANGSVTADGQEEYDMKNISYKVNQTLNYNIEYKSALIQPFIGFGIGKGSQRYNFSIIKGGGSNTQAYTGMILEANIGIQSYIKRWTPFVQFTYRKQNISNIKREYTYQANQDFNVEGVSYKGESILIGTGFSL